jgi:hypothetical protein
MGQVLVARKLAAILCVGAFAGVVLGLGAAAAIAGGGNSANAQLCQKGGWMSLVRSDGTGFGNQGDCVSYGAQGGTLEHLYVFSASLSGANENPPNTSPGSGSATVMWNTATNQMTVDVDFSGLTAGTTASHIHCCAVPPANAGVATQVPRFTGFPVGVTFGSYTHTFDMTDPASYNPAFVTANGGSVATAEPVLLAGLLAGQTYLNIHTTAFPGGEIRGVLILS